MPKEQRITEDFCLPGCSTDLPVPPPSVNGCSRNIPFTEDESGRRRYNIRLYRTMSYTALRKIRESGAEGTSRIDLANELGGRHMMKQVEKTMAKLSKNSSHLLSSRPVLDGRNVSQRYLWKATAPKFCAIAKEFEEFTGGVSIEINQSLPAGKWGTVVMSERNVGRLLTVLKILEEAQITAIPILFKQLKAKEAEEGYSFEMDKKTLNKLIEVLLYKDLAKIYGTVTTVGNQERKLEILCHRSMSQDSQTVIEALELAKKSAISDSRVPPRQSDGSFELKGPARISRKPQKKKKTSKDSSVLPEDTPSEKRDIPLPPKKRRKTEMKQEEACSADSVVRAAIELNEEGHEEEEEDVSKTSRKKYPSTFKHVSTDNVEPISYDPATATKYGYQPKMIRLGIVHEFLFYLLRGYKGKGPGYSEKFLQGISGDSLLREPDSEPHVYLDEISWKRFLPPLPVYKELDGGWCMIQDLERLLPLSLCVMNVAHSFESEDLEGFLSDPIKRHILVSDLPLELQKKFRADRKIARSLCNSLEKLWCMGLVTGGPSHLQNTGFLTLNSSYDYFYLHTGIPLLDTSTSPPRWNTVEPPTSKYAETLYHLDKIETVQLFWHHLRAVSVSSNMGHRLKKCPDDMVSYMSKNAREGSAAFRESLGLIRSPFDSVQEMGFPNGSRLGAGGFHPKLFTYKMRGWELNCAPMVAWWLDDARKRATDAERTIKEMVANLRPMFNSQYLRNLIYHSETHLSSKSWVQTKVNQGSLYVKQPEWMQRSKATSLPGRISGEKLKSGKKRPLDDVDRESLEKQVTQRARFTQKERDMLLFLKALSYFLYPVYRLWLEPRIIRDLMHRLVPESKTKTASGLLAALNRELCRRKERMEQMQLFVKRMESVKELVDMRESNHITVSMDENRKEEIFLKAFAVAERAILNESTDVSHGIGSVEDLEKFLDTHRVFVLFVTYDTEGESDILWRHREAETLDDIKMAVLTNVVFAGYATDSQDGSFSVQQYSIFRSFPDRLVAQVLRRMRTQGFLSYVRADTRRMDLEDPQVTRSDYTLSFFYRHFFYHKMHSQLSLAAGELVNNLSEGGWTNLIKEIPGFVGIVGSLLPQKQICFDVTLPDRAVVTGADEEEDEFLTEESVARPSESDILLDGGSRIHVGNKAVTKLGLAKMRQDRLQDVEASDKRTLNQKEGNALKLKPCQLYGKLIRPKSAEEREMEIEDLIAKIRGMKRKGEEGMSFDDWLMLRDAGERQLMKDVMEFLVSNGPFGASHEELEEEFKEDDRWCRAVEAMLADRQVVKRAVVRPRFVAFSKAHPWYVTSLRRTEETNEEEEASPDNGQGLLKKCKIVRFSPRPWLRPDGSLNRSMLRWMTEGVFLLILANPAMTEQAIFDHFNPAVEPFLVLELLEFLQELDCVTRKKLRIAKKEIKGAFASRKRVIEEMVMWEPTINGLPNFTRVFSGIVMPEFTSNFGQVTKYEEEPCFDLEVKDVEEIEND